MEQLTKEQAIAFAKSGQWKDWTSEELCAFQFHQNKICVPFGEFHKAVEEVLGRPVYTHEFGFSQLRMEFEGKIPTQTLEEIISLIPEEKRIIIKPNEEDENNL